MKKTRKKKQLRPKQHRFLKAYLKGNKTLGEAAIEAGYTSKDAKQAGYQALQQIKRRMPEVMEAHGLTDDALIANYLLPMMNAHETKFFKEGKKRIDVIAWGPRMQGLDAAFKLKGSYAPRDPAEAAQYGVKVVIVDIPRPPKFVDEDVPASTNGHKQVEDE